MTSHVDTETLALLAEGLLEDGEERSVQAHVSECAQCSDQLVALSDVTRVLAEVPAPPIPDGLAGRIDDALRAERERQAAASDPGDPADTGAADSAGAAIPIQRRRGPSKWMPYLVAAAAGVFVIGGGAAVVQGLTASAPPEQAGSSPKGATGGPDAALPYQPSVVASGTEYTADGLSGQAADLIAESEPLSASKGPESNAEGSENSALSAPPETPTGVSSCIHKLSGDDSRRPVLIDIASFAPGDGAAKGEDAWVLVYEAKGGSGYDVRVVTPECTEAGDATVAPSQVGPGD
ncbi:hypothetical protein CLV63_115173 [Murinocardiopsis flavida]|uniref:Uncharacterized protein n=1 Tax=Murinocardiopsis flavida TaxID=645275 RepID=A0A2P8DE57_9ACTN|nr:hypothetical protein [Murinocardiopsis flavida]PSK95510.1 hypothetical protein CLV63_115173 [Murinocardiopsis flavida]